MIQSSEKNYSIIKLGVDNGAGGGIQFYNRICRILDRIWQRSIHETSAREVVNSKQESVGKGRNQSLQVFSTS